MKTLLLLLSLALLATARPSRHKGLNSLIGPGKYNIFDSPFEVIGSSGVPAMHAALMPNGKVVFLDKVESYTELRLSNGKLAYSSVFDPGTADLKPLSYKTNAFCCGGTFLADGSLITVGGNGALTWLDPTVEQGFDAIRRLEPYEQGQGWLETDTKLSSNRWYATAQTMPDGRVFVVAGSLNGMDYTNTSNNNPTYEVLQADGTGSGGNVPMAILSDNMPYWMYPFVHLLPDGTLFIFTGVQSQVFDLKQNKVVRQLPTLPGMYRTYPNTGGSVMLPLRPENNYQAEIMVCGGGKWQGIDSPCDSTCGRIQPLSDNPQWKLVNMSQPRGMVEGVLLLDGTVLWINGVHEGAQGFGIARKPATEALVYNPGSGKWWNDEKSRIPRLYHSVALMLLDGRVLIASSNPNEMPLLEQDVDPIDPYRAFPTEFRVEVYNPKYFRFMDDGRRPVNIELSSHDLYVGGSFGIAFTSDHFYIGSVQVILYQGGFVTHAVHMGQVMLFCRTSEWTTEDKLRYHMTAEVPAEVALAPGPYVVYLVVNGTPGYGQFVTLSYKDGAHKV